LAIQGMWIPATLPFLQLNNTTLVVLKVCDITTHLCDETQCMPRLGKDVWDVGAERLHHGVALFFSTG